MGVGAVVSNCPMGMRKGLCYPPDRMLPLSIGAARSAINEAFDVQALISRKIEGSYMTQKGL